MQIILASAKIMKDKVKSLYPVSKVKQNVSQGIWLSTQQKRLQKS